MSLKILSSSMFWSLQCLEVLLFSLSKHQQRLLESLQATIQPVQPSILVAMIQLMQWIITPFWEVWNASWKVLCWYHHSINSWLTHKSSPSQQTACHFFNGTYHIRVLVNCLGKILLMHALHHLIHSLSIGFIYCIAYLTPINLLQNTGTSWTLGICILLPQHQWPPNHSLTTSTALPKRSKPWIPTCINRKQKVA